MTIKRIVLQTDQSNELQRRANVAAQLASLYDASVHGVYMAPPASYAIRAEIGVPESVWSNYRKMIWEGEAKAKQVFEDTMTGKGISYSWSQPMQNGADGLCHEGMFADLLILGQSAKLHRGSVAADLTDEIILQSRKPCLVVPTEYSKPFKLDRMLIAWNGSTESGRAIQDSVPLLARAKHVAVIQFTRGEQSDVPTDALVAYLGQHGIDVTLKNEQTTADIGQRLLSHAKDENYDLIVLGAYGRTRIREIIMGGVSRRTLESTKCLALMSH